MNSPIIRLHAYRKKQEPIQESGMLRFTEHSGGVVFASSIHSLLLVGLFAFVFGSTLFFVRHTDNGGIFAQHLSGRYLASVVGGVSGLQEATSTAETVPVKVVLYKDPFEDVVIEGKAAYVFDVVSGKVLYEKNKNIQMPLASITKVMMALMVSDVLNDDNIVTVNSNDMLVGEIQDLTVGERWRVKDLLDFTLVTSSNNGASVLAAAAGREYSKRFPSDRTESPKGVFIERMNETARTIGMTSTTFNNESGLDVTTTRSGGYSSAADVALLYQFILANKPTLLEATRRSYANVISADDIVHVAKNTNQTVGSFPGLLASKTGYTDLAGGNLSVVFDSGMGTPIIVVVLGSSPEGRFTDVSVLSRAAREAVAQGAF